MVIFLSRSPRMSKSGQREAPIPPLLTRGILLINSVHSLKIYPNKLSKIMTNFPSRFQICQPPDIRFKPITPGIKCLTNN